MSKDPNRPRPWRRRRYHVAGILAALLAVCAFATNAYLSNQYSPEGAVVQYLSGIKSGDAANAWSVAHVLPPSTTVNVALTDEPALRGALAAGRPDLKSFDITGTGFLNADQTLSAVDVTYETSSGTKQTTFLVERGAERYLGIYPSYHVLVQPALLNLTLPSGAGAVAVDGKSLALKGRRSTLAVWPVAHKIVFGGSALLQPETSTVDAFASLAETVGDPSKLTALGLSKATAAIKAAFDQCAEQTSLHPDGCPQSFDDAWTSSGQWQLVGDPTKDVAISFDSAQTLVATGHFQMIVAYSNSGTDGTSHFPSAGGYSVTLSLDSSDVTVSSIQATAGVLALQRPAAVSDQMVEDLVSKAFAACASVQSGSPADCPQQYFFPDAQDIHWNLKGDPLSGASVSFDQNSGLFTVHGRFDMNASYTVNGYADSHPSDTVGYDTYLVWDGQNLQLVTIAGSYN